jgi:2-polyprenyl-6-methoxyphenol hydroxylase-like FAD-dependent oxidoreductase
MSNVPFTVTVVGGSLAGLAAAAEMRRVAGAEVRVFERSAGQLQARGAGIVMQPEVAQLLWLHGQAPETVCVPLRERRFLHRNGRASTRHLPQLMTAWDVLYRALRSPMSDACYRQDSKLTDLKITRDRVSVTFEDGTSASGELLIGADGIGSTCRSLIFDTIESRYSGYVAWRGLEDECCFPEEMLAQLADRFTFYGVDGMQMLCYLVPGADGETTAGRRRVNWVWYINTSTEALAQITTGRSGRRFRSFLPADEVTSESVARLRELAERTLPGLFARVVRLSRPFLQPVSDVASGHMRAKRRAFLIGDAAGTVRPHTASGTSKAFADAAMLARCLARWSSTAPLPEKTLCEWERRRLAELREIAAAGLHSAAASRLGTPDSPQAWDDHHRTSG